MLGFPEGTYYATVNVAPAVAEFNPVDYFLVHSSLCNDGIRINTTFSSVVAQIAIDKPPLFQILYAPLHPPVLPAGNLRGKTDRIEILIRSSWSFFTFSWVKTHYSENG